MDDTGRLFGPMNRTLTLLRRIRFLTWFFIIGIFLSGVTAIPLITEVNWLVEITGASQLSPSAQPAWAAWLLKVQNSLNDTAIKYPFLFYGTDWLAFGHFVIALAFVGGLIDPVRNRWLFTFGMAACVMVIPFALIFGGIRGIPWWWRCVDCSFGVFGFVPVWLCRKWAVEVERKRGFEDEDPPPLKLRPAGKEADEGRLAKEAAR